MRVLGVKSLNKHVVMLSQVNLTTNGPTWPMNPSVFLTHLYIVSDYGGELKRRPKAPIHFSPALTVRRTRHKRRGEHAFAWEPLNTPKLTTSCMFGPFTYVWVCMLQLGGSSYPNTARQSSLVGALVCCCFHSALPQAGGFRVQPSPMQHICMGGQSAQWTAVARSRAREGPNAARPSWPVERERERERVWAGSSPEHERQYAARKCARACGHRRPDEAGGSNRS